MTKFFSYSFLLAAAFSGVSLAQADSSICLQQVTCTASSDGGSGGRSYYQGVEVTFHLHSYYWNSGRALSHRFALPSATGPSSGRTQADAAALRSQQLSEASEICQAAQEKFTYPKCDQDYLRSMVATEDVDQIRAREISNKILVVTLDEETLRQYGGQSIEGNNPENRAAEGGSRGTRAVDAAVITKIMQAKPRLLFLDFSFSKNSDQDTAENTQKLIDALTQLKQASFPTLGVDEPDNSLVSMELKASPFFYHGIDQRNRYQRWSSACVDLKNLQGSWSYAGMTYISSSSCEESKRPPVVLKVLSLLNYQVPRAKIEKTLVQIPGQAVYTGVVASQPASTIETIPMHQILTQDFDLSRLQDRIILVGSDLPNVDKHFINGESVSGVFRHASLIKTLLLDQASFSKTPDLINFNMQGEK